MAKKKSKKKDLKKKESKKKDLRKKKQQEKNLKNKEAKKKDQKKAGKKALKKKALKKKGIKAEAPAGEKVRKAIQKPIPEKKEGADLSSNHNVRNAVAKLRSLKTSEEVNAFTLGEERATVVKAIAPVQRRVGA